MLSYNVNQVLNTNQQNRKLKGDGIGLSSGNTQFLINQLVWIGISFGISITISMLVPFPISLVVIVGTFLLLNFYLRRRMMERMGSLNATSIMGGMFSPTAAYGSSALKYYCMSCGTQHKQVACPECGSKTRRIG
ncbi:MAG TPA: zinc ribbon domain-containing protein [Candidatus Bathyarchaeia archaeon]|nr:zinc ribbon domain-containing protein [Candidatus Bathyarchaeia archaeon]